MDYRIHHLNCGSMHFPAAPLVCHVLLIEGPNSLALVDTGLGLEDIKNPGGRIGPYRHIMRPALKEAETAYRQIQALGLDPQKVSNIGSGSTPPYLRAQEWAFAQNRGLLRYNQGRLAQLNLNPQVQIINAHDPALFQQF